MQNRRVLFVGYGVVAQAVTPLLFEQFPSLKPQHVKILTADHRGREVADEYGIDFEVCPLTEQNLRSVLAGRLGAGDIVFNFSVGVSSADLIDWCQQHGVLYLDTCVEPWLGGYDPTSRPLLETTNYWLRADALSRRGAGRSTCVIAHGANPGLVSHFLKPALTSFAKHVGLRYPDNSTAAELSERLGIKVVQIAERDTQYAEVRDSPRAFYNTWSVDGLLSEAAQYAEVAWGTHEKELPCGASRHDFSAKSGVVLRTASVDTIVASWVPSVGAQRAYLITHHEAHSIGDFLASYSSDGVLKYRPTVYYAYRPSDLTCRSLENWQAIGRKDPLEKITMCGELVGGMDELGVLLVSGHGSLWYGSTLTLSQARSLAKHNNATSLQVAASVIGAFDWMLANPCAGVVEAEDMDSERVLRVAAPYLGELAGVYSDWTPYASAGLTMNDFLEGL